MSDPQLVRLSLRLEKQGKEYLADAPATITLRMLDGTAIVATFTMSEWSRFVLGREVDGWMKLDVDVKELA